MFLFFELIRGALANTLCIAEADADVIPVPGQSELHGRCRCGVLLSPYFGALFVADLIVGIEELELHYRCRGRFKSAKAKRGRREGNGKKSVTTICDKRHDNLRHFMAIRDIL